MIGKRRGAGSAYGEGDGLAFMDKLAEGRNGDTGFLNEPEEEVITGLLHYKSTVTERVLEIGSVEQENGRTKTGNRAEGVEKTKSIFGGIIEVTGQARQAGDRVEGSYLEGDGVSSGSSDVKGSGAVAKEEGIPIIVFQAGTGIIVPGARGHASAPVLEAPLQQHCRSCLIAFQIA